MRSWSSLCGSAVTGPGDLLLPSSFARRGDHSLQVAVEKIESSLITPDEVELVNERARKCLLLDLLTHIPLHEVVCGVILFLQAKVHHLVDLVGHLGLMVEQRLENI